MIAQTLPFPVRTTDIAAPPRPSIEDALRCGGALDEDGIAAARAFAAERGVTFVRAVLSLRLVDDATLYPLLAGQYAARRIDPVAHPVDPRLTDRLGVDLCLRNGIVPWRDTGGVTIILVPLPEVYDRLRPQLQACFGPTVFALAPERAIDIAILEARGPLLAARAQSRTPDRFSCRHWNTAAVQEPVLLALILLVGSALLWPGVVLAAATIWAILSLVLCMGLKAAAALAAHRQMPPAPPPPAIARLPEVSIIVALYREADIAERLVERLSKLDYPRDKLEILLAIEERDTLTRNALEHAALPEWMRLAIVPHGKLKTKPRALNHALGLCRGSIIAIFDAEDAPAPDQVRRMVERFHATPADVACLQGVLDYYNPRTNWIARCFTIEYATLFRVILPGIQRMGLAIPLGGTTLYVRREALEKVGAWDAHNVTEDADLGLRLARFGYRTEVVDTVTHEEANLTCPPWAPRS